MLKFVVDNWPVVYCAALLAVIVAVTVFVHPNPPHYDD